MFITIFPRVSGIRAWYCMEQGWIINPSILIIDSSPQYSAYAPGDNHVQSQKSFRTPQQEMLTDSLIGVFNGTLTLMALSTCPYPYGYFGRDCAYKLATTPSLQAELNLRVLICV
jgi:hypothetical protein